MSKKILIAIPCMEQMPTEFVMSLTGLQQVELTSVSYSMGSLVYVSRDKLGALAVRNEFDYVLWLDSDMVFKNDLLISLLSDLNDDVDMVTSLCFRRKAPYTPVIWSKLRYHEECGIREDEEYHDYPENELFEIEGCGFGALLMKTEVLNEVFKHYGRMFSPIDGYGEDISFCIRARELGYRIWCDSRIEVGHVGKALVDSESFKAWKNRGDK